MRWMDGITDSMDMNLSKLWETVKDRNAWHACSWCHKELEMTQRLKNSIQSPVLCRIQFLINAIQKLIIYQLSTVSVINDNCFKIYVLDTCDNTSYIPLAYLIQDICDEKSWILLLSAQLLSYVVLFVTPRTVACQSPPSMDFSGKNTGLGCHFLFQGIFLTQGQNPHLLHLLHCRRILSC